MINNPQPATNNQLSIFDLIKNFANLKPGTCNLYKAVRSRKRGFTKRCEIIFTLRSYLFQFHLLDNPGNPFVKNCGNLIKIFLLIQSFPDTDVELDLRLRT